MILLQYWLQLTAKELGIIITVIIIILGSIKVKSVEINFWGWLAKKVGNALNRDIILKINQIEIKQKEIEQKIDLHVEHDKLKEALESRKCILRFAREILKGERHTKEDFLTILEDIDLYENYCKNYPDFPNRRAVFASKLIQSNYQERLEKADFLAEEYRCQLAELSKDELIADC